MDAAGVAQVLKGAHAPGSAITSLAFSRGGFTLLSRSEDETLKVRMRARPARGFGCAGNARVDETSQHELAQNLLPVAVMVSAKAVTQKLCSCAG